MSPLVEQLPSALFGLFVLYLFVHTDRKVPENVRLVVFRRGRYSGILGPGRWITVPFLDKVTHIVLDRELPDWRAMSEEQIRDTIEERLALRAYHR